MKRGGDRHHNSAVCHHFEPLQLSLKQIVSRCVGPAAHLYDPSGDIVRIFRAKIELRLSNSPRIYLEQQ
jgi:hypothetical protein